MNANKVPIACLATGVGGLDNILGGGLPEFSFNLIAGMPGSGKTTLAHQMMFSLATADRCALYLTVLGEPPLKMLRYQQQFNFFDASKIGNAVRFVSLADDTLSGDLDRVLARIITEVEAATPSLVFVDSFRSVVLSGSGSAEQTPNPLKKFVQQLGMLMTSWQATTFLVDEYDRKTDINLISTVADGLIWLHQSVQHNSMVRQLEVTKMRGHATIPGLHSFRIDQNGIEVFALPDRLPALQNSVQSSGQNERLMMGIPHLDDMMGGGLPRGYSLLVAGPSGSGKSILAAAFLLEGARIGEAGVIAVFEQHPNRAHNHAIADLIRQERIGLVDARSPDLSIEEVTILLLRQVQQRRATRLVIDSLTGFELSLAPTYRPDFRESMLRLVTALANTGVSVLMTSELEDRYTDLRFSPYGTAFLTDAIIVQRYIEVDSRLRRVLAVVKVRASDHSDELREFTIDGAGIHIGSRLCNQEGLLGGSPTTKNSAAGSIPLQGE